MTDYSELKRLAEAATPGPWRWLRFDEDEGAYHSLRDEVDAPVVSAFGVHTEGRIETDDSNAAYIVAASPSVILAILAELDALRANGESFERAALRSHGIDYK